MTYNNEKKPAKPDFYGFFEKLVPKPFKPLYRKIGREKVLYLFFGALTTLISIVSFAVAVNVIGRDVKGFSVYSQIISFVLAVSFAFVVNKRYVFESAAKGVDALKETLEFFGMRLASFGFETVVLWFLVEKNGLNETLIKLLLQIAVLILNYIFSKLIIFRAKK